MITSHKYRIYPDEEQRVLFHKHFGCTRLVWNLILAYCEQYYETTRQNSPDGKGEHAGRKKMQEHLVVLKQDPKYSFLKECNSQSLQVVCQHLQWSYQRFFAYIQKVKAGEKPKKVGKPKFKKKNRNQQSFCVTQHVRIENDLLYLPKFKTGIKIKLHRPITDGYAMKRATISCQNGKYYVSIVLDNEQEYPSEVPVQTAVGIDMGLTDVAITSDGERMKRDARIEKKEKRKPRYQRDLSRKKKGSKNYQKAQDKFRRLCEDIKNIRMDNCHKFTTDIINRYDLIAIEDLNIPGMMQNHHLAGSISKVSWGMIANMLSYKAKNHGKTLVRTERFFASSQLCSACGEHTGKKPLHIRHFTCPHCGAEHDRDINAAKNILAEGYLVWQQGREGHTKPGTDNVPNACGE